MGPLIRKYIDRTHPLDKTLLMSNKLLPVKGLRWIPWMPRVFGNAGMEHMKIFGTKPEHFAKIAYKNHQHSLNNPYSQKHKKFTV